MHVQTAHMINIYELGSSQPKSTESQMPESASIAKEAADENRAFAAEEKDTSNTNVPIIAESGDITNGLKHKVNI